MAIATEILAYQNQIQQVEEIDIDSSQKVEISSPAPERLNMIIRAKILGVVDAREKDGDLVYYVEGLHPSLGICSKSPYGEDQTTISNLTLLMKGIRLRDIS